MAKIKALQKVGTSRGIVIDKTILQLLDLDHDSAAVELEITPEGLLLKPARMEQVYKRVSEKHRKSLDKLGK
jgi:antitoxin component of MazEF toxin-antitoxin module